MGSHVRRFGDKELEIRVRRLPNGEPDVVAHEHLPGEPVADLPVLPDEEKWVQAIRKILVDIFGPASG